MSVRDWLLHRANDEFFSFNSVDFDNDCDEILRGHLLETDPAAESESRNKLWGRLQAWQRDREYLSSLNLHRIIAKKMRTVCRKAQSAETIESWVKLDSESAQLDGLADEIANLIRAAWHFRAPLIGNPVPKFSDELKFDSIDKFHLGLENLIGYPPTNSDFLAGMKREHEHGDTFVDHKGRQIDPKVEWNIVMRSNLWNIRGAGCEPTFNIKKRDCVRPLPFYIEMAAKKFADAGVCASGCEVLNEAEVAALRLWTGPMHKKYAELLRNPQIPGCPYVTTLHAMNSGITKLARIWRLPSNRKVYRGYRHLSLKKLNKDVFQCVGGVEKSVLATSEDFNIAVQYSGDGAFILEFDVGQVNRGADVEWLSQFPYEREILFNALSNVEFVSSPQQRFIQGCGTILVYQVCVSANVKSKTLNEFVRLRKDLHCNLVDVLTQEARQMISMRESCSRYGLIKRLGLECRNLCDDIVKQAQEADVSIFNEGTPTYVNLVETTIMMESRSLEIIDLASLWFQDRKADPNALGKLLGWQFHALRKSFEFFASECPEVTTIVLEQDRQVESLFGASSLNVGALHKMDSICNLAKLLSLNPELLSLEMEIASAAADMWERVYNELCPGRPNLSINNFHIAGIGISSLQQLEFRNSGYPMAAMISPALLFYTPSTLTSLSLCGTPIACTGAESLGRALTGLKMLKYVDLRSCHIADRGCTGISQYLPGLSELEELTLAHNKVNDDGFSILASSICTGAFARLKLIDMRFNQAQLPSIHLGPQCVLMNHAVFKLSITAAVACLAWSPRGNQIVCESCHGHVTVWDVKTGKKIEGTALTFRQWDDDKVQSAVWSPPQGDQIICGLAHQALVWHAESGDLLDGIGSRAQYSGEVVAWSPLCNQIATVTCLHNANRNGYSRYGEDLNSTRLIIWETNGCNMDSKLLSIQIEQPTETAKFHRLSWSPGGDQIAVGSDDKMISIWDAKNGDQVSKLKGYNGYVKSLAWSPGGFQIVSGHGRGERCFDPDHSDVIIWDAKTGDRVLTLKGHRHGVTSVSWRPVLEKIASGAVDNKIIIWDAKTGDQLFTLNSPSGCPSSLAWSTEGDLVSGSHDGTIIIWSFRTEAQKSSFKVHACVQNVAWSPGGNQFAGGLYDNTIIIWDSKTGRRISTLVNSSKFDSRDFAAPTCVAWSPGGDKIASGTRYSSTIIWDAMTGDQILTLAGHDWKVSGIAWSPGGDRIVSTAISTIAIVWDVKTGDKLLELKQKQRRSSMYCVSWSPGGDHIVSGGCRKIAYGGHDDESGIITIWDARTGSEVSELTGHAKEVRSIVWSPGGDKIASGSYDKTIKIWDFKTGSLVQALTLEGHSSEVFSVAWSPWGDQIVSGGDGTRKDYQADSSVHGLGEVIIWDAQTGAKVALLNGHTSMVKSVAWSPRGDQIASGAADNTIAIWNVQTKGPTRSSTPWSLKTCT